MYSECVNIMLLTVNVRLFMKADDVIIACEKIKNEDHRMAHAERE